MNIQRHNFSLDHIGTGSIFSLKRAYFAYNATSKSLEVKELYWHQRILRSLFGAYHETHLSYIVKKVSKRMTKEGFALPSTVQARLKTIWEKAHPQQTFPLGSITPRKVEPPAHPARPKVRIQEMAKRKARFIRNIDEKAIICKDISNVRQMHTTRKDQIAAHLSFLETIPTQDHVFITVGCGEVPEHNFPNFLFDALLRKKSVCNIIIEQNFTDYDGSRIWDLLEKAYKASSLTAAKDINWDSLSITQFRCGHPSGHILPTGWKKEDITRYHALFEKYLEQALVSGKDVTIGWSRGDPLSEELRGTYNRLQAKYPRNIHLWFAHSDSICAVANGQIQTKLSFKGLTSKTQINDYVTKALQSEFTFLRSLA